jgi:hypothetical protein
VNSDLIVVYGRYSHTLHICHRYTVSTSYLSRDVRYYLHRCFDKVKVAI